MPYRPIQFQLTVVKPYYKDNSFKPLQDVLKDILDNTLKDALEDALENALENALKDALEENYNKYALEGDYNSNTIVVDIPQPQHSRGRLKGSRNHQYLIDFEEQFIAAIKGKIKLLIAFIIAKEKANFKLIKQL